MTPTNRDQLTTELGAIELLLASEVWSTKAEGANFPAVTLKFHKHERGFEWTATLAGGSPRHRSIRPFPSVDESKRDARKYLESRSFELHKSLGDEPRADQG